LIRQHIAASSRARRRQARKFFLPRNFLLLLVSI
jgi:hypothetical protein